MTIPQSSTEESARIQPTKILRKGADGIEITWQDGATHFLSSKVLRENCPSATSRAKRGDSSSHETPLTPKRPSSLRIVSHEIDEELQLKEIWGVGNYAIGMLWGDGHNTGIYSYTLLRELAENGTSSRINQSATCE